MENEMVNTIKQFKHDLNETKDIKQLAEKLKDKKIVLLGEASHGTHEYYIWRSRITRYLLEHHNFDFVAVEGDWPPCYTLNRSIKNYKDAEDSIYNALQEFKRWPAWMWSNWEVHEWAQWLKEFNSKIPSGNKKGFYGLDVYSLWESLDAIVDYLKKEDPNALKTARKAMQCFEPYRGEGGQEYALSTRLIPEGCTKEVSEMLTEIRSKTPIYNSDEENVFSTEQNAIIAKNAEEYYREMMQGGNSTWNLRDKHMMNTLVRLIDFHGNNAKGIVWAHNTHIGDARYTDMSKRGLFNIGELARKYYGRENVSAVGFGSAEGSVLAGKDWGSQVESMKLPPARKDSWENICRNAGSHFFILSEDLKNSKMLKGSIPHRAVGVVYTPEYDHIGNYVDTNIPDRYDAFIFIEKTKALNEIKIGTKKDKTPETYPFGL